MGAPPPLPGSAQGRGAPRARERSPRTRNFSSLRKKSFCAAPSAFFFFPPSFLVSLPLLPFESFFPPPFTPPSLLTAWLIQPQCQSTFFPPPLLHLNTFKAPPSTPPNPPNLINWALRAAARESQKGEGRREQACGTPDRRAGGCAFHAPGPSRHTRS